jgi:hypothetical protein
VLDAAPDRLLVLERFGGSDGLGAVSEGSASAAQVQELSRQIGRALGKIASTPLPAPAAGYSPLRDFTGLAWSPCQSWMLARYLTTCRRIQTVIPAYTDPFCDASLALLASQVEQVDHQRHIFFHEDIWNLRVDATRFLGFYDLEMCRLGTESMQLGVAVELCGPGRLEWGHLQRGYEAEVGRSLEDANLLAVLAMNHFYHWIRVCGWGEWDGDPAHTDHRRASTEDADHYITRMKAACAVLAQHAALSAWFPGLE